MAGTAVIARARLCNVESFFCLLPLRGETAGRGGLGVRRSLGARGGIELSGTDRRRRPFPLDFTSSFLRDRREEGKALGAGGDATGSMAKN